MCFLKVGAHYSPHRTDGTHRTHRILVSFTLILMGLRTPDRIGYRQLPTRIHERAFNPMRADDADALLQEMFLMEMFYAMNNSII